jgi:hypothetical protein
MNGIDDKDWIVYIRAPLMPQGIEVMHYVSLDEVSEVLEEVKARLPEWRASAIRVNNALKAIDKISMRRSDNETSES